MRHYKGMSIVIDRPKRPEDLIGRTIWLHHERARRRPQLVQRIGGMDQPLKVTGRYESTVVVTTEDGREHHLVGNVWSLLSPADQVAAEKQRREETGR